MKGSYGIKNGGDIVDKLLKRQYKGSDGQMHTGADIFNDAGAFAEYKKALKGARGATDAKTLASALTGKDKANLSAEDISLAQSFIGHDNEINMDGLSLMENIYKERAKQLNNIQEYYQQFLNTQDPTRLKDIQKVLTENADLFSENGGAGVNLGIGGISAPSLYQLDPNGNVVKDANGNPVIGNQKAFEDWAASNFVNVKKNDKALSDVQNDIQARDVVETESGTKKDDK